MIVSPVRNGNELTSATQEAFRENADISRKIGQVSKAVQEMDKATQSTAANAEESAAASEELNAQAEQMKSYVGDLVRVISGSNGDGLARVPAGSGSNIPKLPADTAGRQLLGRKRVAVKIARPDQMIPLGDEDFKNF